MPIRVKQCRAMASFAEDWQAMLSNTEQCWAMASNTKERVKICDVRGGKNWRLNQEWCLICTDRVLLILFHLYCLWKWQNHDFYMSNNSDGDWFSATQSEYRHICLDHASHCSFSVWIEWFKIAIQFFNIASLNDVDLRVSTVSKAIERYSCLECHFNTKSCDKYAWRLFWSRL